MSGKRRAVQQLTDKIAYMENERDGRGNDDDEDDNNNSHEPKRASEEVLARRKILKPRGLKSSTASFTPKKPSPLFANKPISSSSNDNNNNDKLTKIKALNLKFLEALANAKDKNPIADFRPILNKYSTYYEQIESEYPIQQDSSKSSNFSSFSGFMNLNLINSNTTDDASSTNKDEKTKPKPFSFLLQNNTEMSSSIVPSAPATKAPVVEANNEKPDSDSDSDSDDEVKVEGPKFTLDKPPVTKNAVFTFGAKPKPEIEFSDSDSEDDIKVEGPKFTLNTNPTENKSFFGGFKLTAAATATDDKLEVSAPAQSTEQKKPAPVFNFATTSSTAQPPTNPFNSTPSSNSGTQTIEKKLDEPVKPVFSLSQPILSTSGTDLEKKPTFSFGSQLQLPLLSEQTLKPFTFGQTSNTNETILDKPTFQFNKQVTSTESKENKLAFSFGQQLSTESKGSKPTFSFGQSGDTITTTQDKPTAFSFGQADNNNKTELKPFAFASSGITKPFSFNSGNENNNDEDLNKATTKPFSFGQSNSSITADSKPKFSFGTTTAPQKDGGELQGDEKPKFNFSSTFNFNSASSNNGNSLFSFSPKPLNTTTMTTTTTTTTANTEEVEEVEEHEPNVDFKPVVKLDHELETKTGEEDEIVKCSKRSKLMLLANNEYETKGIGELRVLYNSKTQKTRVLLRLEGSLRVVLNSMIQHDFKFEKIGTKGNMIKFPTVNGEGQLETYVIQVKTATDGDELLKAIEEGKL